MTGNIGLKEVIVCKVNIWVRLGTCSQMRGKHGLQNSGKKGFEA